MTDIAPRPYPVIAAVAALGLSLGVDDLDDLDRIWHELRSSPLPSGPAEAVRQFRQAALRVGIILPDLTAKLTANVTQNTPRRALAQPFDAGRKECPQTVFD